MSYGAVQLCPILPTWTHIGQLGTHSLYTPRSLSLFSPGNSCRLSFRRYHLQNMACETCSACAILSKRLSRPQCRALKLPLGMIIGSGTPGSPSIEERG